MEKNNSTIVLVYPSPLVITKQRNSNYYESKLNLSNLSNEYVLLKIYNNQHALYSAKPSTSYIAPKDKANVLIKRFSKEENKSKVGKDRFLLCFYTINKIINNDEEAKEAFKSKIYNESSKQETMLYVVLKEEENEEINITPEYDENNLEQIGNDYIKGIQMYQDMNEINKLRDELNKLKYELNMKENELRVLNNKIIYNAQEDVKSKYKDIKFVTFASMDSSVQCGIKSLDKDKYNDVEEKHKKNYKNLSNTKNMFIANSKPILNFKKMNENNKKDGDIFQLDKIE